jgi:hypothetical protein
MPSKMVRDSQCSQTPSRFELSHKLAMPGTMNESEAKKDLMSLSWPRAVWGALRSCDIDFYPRVADSDGNVTLLTTEALMEEFAIASSHWTDIVATDIELDNALKLARQSLDEVKDQTEYQDQKATRLLTVTTFLTALSGALFARLNDAYPLAGLAQKDWWLIALMSLAYLVFGLFLLSSLGGALVTFYATRTRFKYTDANVVAKDKGSPKSRLFYRSITGVRPKIWSLAFVEGTDDIVQGQKPKLRANLKRRYLADLVGETYLIACKTADKLRYLDPAQRLLAMALQFLLAWVLILAMLAVIPHEKSTGLTQVKLIAPSQSLPLTVELIKMPSLVIVRTLTPAPVEPNFIRSVQPEKIGK